MGFDLYLELISLWGSFCSLGRNGLDLDTVKMIAELLKTNTTITSIG